MNAVLATNVRTARESNHWTQQHLADTADILVRTVQRVEKGEGASLETLGALANAFDVTIDVLQRDYQALYDELKRQHEELAKTHDIVSVTPVTQPHHLEIVGSNGAYIAHCAVDDDAARDTFARLQQYLTDLGDLWPEIGAVSRNEYLKEVFELVRELNQLGVVVCAGKGTSKFGGGAKAVQLPTFCLVAWPENEVHGSIAIER